MDETLATKWAATEAAMPRPWRLDSLRCASTGLAAEERSERWVAVALDAAGHVAEAEAASPEEALDALVQAVRSELAGR